MAERSDTWLICVAVAALLPSSPPAFAQESDRQSEVREARAFLTSESKSEATDYTLAMALDYRESDPGGRLDVDLSPLLVVVASFLRDHGIAAVEHRHAKKKDPVAVSASFDVGASLPALRVQFGDRSPEPFGAFYSGNKGIRWALIWPVRRMTLRIEGGQDSEFGYFGIAGAQWVHPKQPIAVGFGVPMNLRNARGDIGVIAQFRMKIF
jgi:hypothetical protein